MVDFDQATGADIQRLKRRLAAPDGGDADAALSAPPQSSGLDDERPVRSRDGWVGIWEPAPHRGAAAVPPSGSRAGGPRT